MPAEVSTVSSWSPQVGAALIAGIVAICLAVFQIINQQRLQQRNAKEIERLKAELGRNAVMAQETLKASLGLQSKVLDDRLKGLKEVVDAFQKLKVQFRRFRDPSHIKSVRKAFQSIDEALQDAREVYSRNQLLLPEAMMRSSHGLFVPVEKLRGLLFKGIEDGNLEEVIQSERFNIMLDKLEEEHLHIRDEARSIVDDYATSLGRDI